jgi:hypothetical protein
VRGVLAPLFGSVRFDPKRHEDVSNSKSFAKSSKTCFLLAFIRVFRGLNFGCGGAALGNPWFELSLARNTREADALCELEVE